MLSLFDTTNEEKPSYGQPSSSENKQIPLAERMRPTTLQEIIGQEHLTEENGVLQRYIRNGKFPSCIFWGPPGCGKTTLAGVIASVLQWSFVRLSAVEAGVKEVREVLQRAERSKQNTILFIDEIHRFNKAQQDALLHAVERGIITLIGATTENPSFAVNTALLSRCRVYVLKAVQPEGIRTALERALLKDTFLQSVSLTTEATEAIIHFAQGDVRTALNILEAATMSLSADSSEKKQLTQDDITVAAQQRMPAYDKHGEQHHDVISAFIKSLRGSDPDAALYWLALMLTAGEDPLFIARRMVVFASEDIGNAEPSALPLAMAVFQAVQSIGMPEARINLAQGVTFLASAPKSNASYVAINAAMKVVQEGELATPPLHLRNAPTQLMKSQGYGRNYAYPHDYDEHFVAQQYFPDTMQPVAFYRPSNQGREQNIASRLQQLWTDGRYS